MIARSDMTGFSYDALPARGGLLLISDLLLLRCP